MKTKNAKKKQIVSRRAAETEEQQVFIKRCIELARRGAGKVSPNPMVGCLIVKDGKIIAEGYHKEFGKNHAEINAIEKARRQGFNLKGAEIYVNLEPCVHYGKTPPCTDEIIRNKFKRVIIGTRDANPLNKGAGIKRLKKSGIETTERILVDDCRELNKFFFKYMRTGIPYVTLKAAMTLDGKIADKNHKSKWISSFESRKLVHKLRSEYDAVLIGRRTVEYDNPSLTVRHVKGRNPYRIIIDKDLKLDLRKKVFSDKFRNKTIVLTSSKINRKAAETLRCRMRNKKIDLSDALKKLGMRGIASILVEGGAETYSEFLKQNLADELIIFMAPEVMGNGLDAFKEKDLAKSRLKEIKVRKAGKDIIINMKISPQRSTRLRRAEV